MILTLTLNSLSMGGWLALAWFLFALLLLEQTIEYVVSSHSSAYLGLSQLMANERRIWMKAAAHRDLRMIETQIIIGQQQGATFFGSACILAIGGSFSLLSATDSILLLYQDLDIGEVPSRYVWGIKVIGLAVIFVYSFFKFAWSYRLFNYSAILVGAIPVNKDANEAVREKAADKAAEMNINASNHFTAGLRGIFFALAYLGWFISDLTFALTTLFVVLVLLRRQYLSGARRRLLD